MPYTFPFPASYQPMAICANPPQHNVTGAQYNKNYEFDFDFGGHWGRCSVVMTSVLGHLTTSDFGPDFKQWRYPPPERLFDAPIFHGVAKVSSL